MRKAFTLIELLVVVAVIAILAALLFPVFARATERAKSAHCASNLRQVGGAIGLYLADYDDRYPWAWRTYWALHGRAPSLREALRPYTTTDAIWVCPSDIGEVFLQDPQGFHMHTKPFHVFAGTSYEYFGIGLGYLTLAGRPTSAVKLPSTGVLCVEIRPWHGGYDPLALDLTKDPALCNILHTDLHVSRASNEEWSHEAESALWPQ